MKTAILVNVIPMCLLISELNFMVVCKKKKMAPNGSGTVKCGLVEIRMVSWKELCHC